jgi:hypothetical protein
MGSATNLLCNGRATTRPVRTSDESWREWSAMQVQRLRLVLAALVIAAGAVGAAATGDIASQPETAVVVATGDGGGSDDTPWD